MTLHEQTITAPPPVRIGRRSPIDTIDKFTIDKFTIDKFTIDKFTIDEFTIDRHDPCCVPRT
jgi:hypothetical protein